MSLNAAQRKKVSSGRISDAADVMLEQSLHMIKCVLLKHEIAQLEVMAEMQDRINELESRLTLRHPAPAAPNAPLSFTCPSCSRHTWVKE